MLPTPIHPQVEFVFYHTDIHTQYALPGAACKNKHSHLQKRQVFHFILKKKGKSETFNMSVINKDSLRNSINSLVDELVAQTTQLIDELFPESYPANIFKNSTKCKQLEDKFNTIIHD